MKFLAQLFQQLELKQGTQTHTQTAAAVTTECTTAPHSQVVKMSNTVHDVMSFKLQSNSVLNTDHNK